MRWNCKAVRVALPGLRSFFSLRNPRAHEIITMPLDDWKEIQRRGAGDYEAHNKWLAFALKQLMVRPSSGTEAFESLVVNTVAPEQQLDGRWLFERMQKPIIALTGKEERAKYEDFKAASYFVGGDAAVSECVRQGRGASLGL